MKIPKKKELLRLQAKYRTDKKMGEALGGAPAHLVAYWRKKKKIPDCDLPKYSQKQIKVLWETYGSDKQAAAQLGITPAAFYKWRQKYGIKERPRQLRLSHLQLNLFPESVPLPAGLGQTLIEKLAGRKLVRKGVVSGEIYELEPDLIILSSDWDKLLEDSEALGLKRVKRPDRVWAKLPGWGPVSNGSFKLLQPAKEFLHKNQVKNVISAREGYPLQVLWEKSIIAPLGLALGTDKTTIGAGFLGCWGKRLESSEIIQVLESGKVKLEVSSTVKITLQGKLNPAIFASDIYSYLAHQIDTLLLPGRLLEFSGEVVSSLSLPQRMALALMWSQTPVGGIIFSVDQTIRKYYLSRAKKSVPLLEGDEKAAYVEKLEFDLSHLEPQVSSGPPASRIVSVRQQKKKPVSKIVLGAGLHGRLEELEVAARILSKRKVHPEVQLVVVPCSRQVMLSALRKGYLRTLLEAGAILCDPGLENWEGLFSMPGPVLTTCFLNSNHPEIFQPQDLLFVNPATAAASALKGEITDPRDYL